MYKILKPVWVTKDNREFDTEEGARRHEKLLQLTALFERLPLDWNDPVGPSDAADALLRDWLLAGELAEAMLDSDTPDRLLP